MAKFDLSFFYNKRNLYILGFLLAFVVTFMEVSRGRHLNFLPLPIRRSIFGVG